MKYASGVGSKDFSKGRRAWGVCGFNASRMRSFLALLVHQLRYTSLKYCGWRRFPKTKKMIRGGSYWLNYINFYGDFFAPTSYLSSYIYFSLGVV